MGTKVTVDDLTNILNASGMATTNDNFDKVADEFDKVLYRDGSLAVTGDIDMDSKRLLNLPAPVYPTDVIRLTDAAALSGEGPQGPAGTNGSPGGNITSVGLFTGLSGMDVPSGTTRVRSSGHTAENIGDAWYAYSASVDATYVTANPLTSFIALDGRGFALDEHELMPDHFGALGIVTSNDSAAMAALSAYVNARGTSAYVALRGGAVYGIGGQIWRAAQYTYYNWLPEHIFPLEFANLPSVMFKGNGAKIRSLDDAKYGVFNDDGTIKATAPGYLGVGAATPYYFMIYAHGCGAVHIENVELDGNFVNATKGGPFSDTGIQLPMDGYYLTDNAGPTTLTGIYSHHHGRDGGHIWGLATSDASPSEGSTMISCRHEYSGRQGVSIVGGKGWVYISSTFNHTGRLFDKNAVQLGSNPACGIDFEAEGGRAIRDHHFIRCDFINNVNQGIVADSGTNTRRITFDDCLFVGTTNYSIWPNRPDFLFRRCTIVGTATQLWFNETAPEESVQFEDCVFTNNPAYSPTGAVYTLNGLLFEGGVTTHNFTRCVFIKYDSAVGGGGNTNGPLYTNCTAISKGTGSFNMYGRWEGSDTRFISDPGPLNLPTDTAGPCTTSWFHRTGGVTTKQAATVDSAGNILSYQRTGLDADYTIYPGTDQMTWIYIAPLTADRTLTLSATGAIIGSRFRIRRAASSTGAFNLNVKNPAATTLKALATGEDAIFEWTSASGWELVSS